MASPVPPPVFTFRGHQVGVTALVCHHPLVLYSGDEEGNIISWNLKTFKRIATWDNVCHGKILSIKIIQLVLDTSASSDILVIQTRNDGVHLNRIDTLKSITNFPTYQSLFSRGDAVTLPDRSEAILAYPSAIDSHLVTVRYLGNDAVTLMSGSAKRHDEDKKRRESAVFDIRIKSKGSAEYNLFTAYEDGCIFVYRFSRLHVETVPELNVTGLRIEPIQKFDFGISDFVSAFDVLDKSDNHLIVCGSPKRELIFLTCATGFDKKGEETNTVILNKPGVSAISIRPDEKLVAAASWDNSVRVFSMKSRRHLATFKNHTKQVSTIIFARTNPDEPRTLMCCSSLDGTISVFDVFN